MHTSIHACIHTYFRTYKKYTQYSQCIQYMGCWFKPPSSDPHASRVVAVGRPRGDEEGNPAQLCSGSPNCSNHIEHSKHRKHSKHSEHSKQAGKQASNQASKSSKYSNCREEPGANRGAPSSVYVVYVGMCV